MNSTPEMTDPGVGFVLKERAVCVGCGRAMTVQSARRHVKRCQRNMLAKGCGTCVHNTGSGCDVGVSLSATHGNNVFPTWYEWICNCSEWVKRT